MDVVVTKERLELADRRLRTVESGAGHGSGRRRDRRGGVTHRSTNIPHSGSLKPAPEYRLAPWRTSRSSAIWSARSCSSPARSWQASRSSPDRRRHAGEIALLLGAGRIGAALVGVGLLAVLGFGLWLVHLGHWGFGAGWVDAGSRSSLSRSRSAGTADRHRSGPVNLRHGSPRRVAP